MTEIGIIGAGYVGLTLSVALAMKERRVTSVDVNENRVELLQQGKAPQAEPDVQTHLKLGLLRGNLFYSTDYHDLSHCQVVFVCVDTPWNGQQMDLTALWNSIEQWALHSQTTERVSIVIKSTVPVMTCEKIQVWLDDKFGGSPRRVRVYHWPEFMREGSALSDLLEPERLVLGGTGSTWDPELLEIIADFDVPTLMTDLNNSELIKLASNAYLATRLSFVNQMAFLAESVGADVDIIAQGMGMDKRIGQAYLRAGIGFGGPCLEKDVLTLNEQMKQTGNGSSLLQSVIEINENRLESAKGMIEPLVADLAEPKIAVWGVTFKGGTSDIANSPAVEIVRDWHLRGWQITVHDPAYCNPQLRVSLFQKQKWMEQLNWSDQKEQVAIGADILAVLSDWDEYRSADLVTIGQILRYKRIMDGRNLYPVTELQQLDYQFVRVGYQKNTILNTPIAKKPHKV